MDALRGRQAVGVDGAAGIAFGLGCQSGLLEVGAKASAEFFQEGFLVGEWDSG
jgi:hypothetical protein